MKKDNCHYCGKAGSPYIKYADKAMCEKHQNEFFSLSNVPCQHEGCLEKAIVFVERTLKYMCSAHKTEGSDAKRPPKALDNLMGISPDKVKDPTTAKAVKAINDDLERGPKNSSKSGAEEESSKSQKGLKIVKYNGVTFTVPMNDASLFFDQFNAWLKDGTNKTDCSYLQKNIYIEFHDIASAWFVGKNDS